MITDVWYVVENQGDGSCRVQFCESKELAELFDSFDIENQDEAVGFLPIEHDGSLKIKDMMTIDDAIEEASEDIDESWWTKSDQEKLDKLILLKGEIKTSEEAEKQYPEHDKMHLVKERSQSIGEFLEWLQAEQKIVFGEYTNENPDTLFPAIQISTEKQLALYFDIDLNKIEEEKFQMLTTLREDNS